MVGRRLLAVNTFLTAVYEAPTRLSSLLAGLGFDDLQIEALRTQHLSQIVDGFIGIVQTDLDNRFRQIVCCRYGLDGHAPEPLAHIGRRLGLSHEKAGQLESDALACCRDQHHQKRWMDGLALLATPLVGRPLGHAPAGRRAPVEPGPAIDAEKAGEAGTHSRHDSGSIDGLDNVRAVHGSHEAASALMGQALRLLRLALDDPSAGFRDQQWEAIERLVERRARLLVVQRTGWGKSIVYFVTTRLLRDRGSGPTLLVSPLLSLMRNQLLAAERLGVRAATINSSNASEWNNIRARLEADEVDILLISPERLANDDFRDNVLMPVAGRIAFFVVDEAHCISDWGHDFRPDYRRMVRVLQALPPTIPVLATTATANDRVVDDVTAHLGADLTLLRGPLTRASLRLQNIDLPHQAARLAWLAERVPHLSGSGVIYTLTIRDAQRVAEWLQTRGIDAAPYWGALDGDARESLERRLLANEIKALVATSALGMGFDKPDLGFVIHFQRPGSVVHYYQQVGRAGRALDEAYGVLLGGAEDQEIADYFVKMAFPPEEHVKDILTALAEAEDGLSIPMLEQRVNLSRGQIDKALKSLAVQTPAPVARENGRWYRSAVVYEPDLEMVRRLTRLRQQEQMRMRDYMRSRECLMVFLARELDDPSPVPCGRCAPCCGHPLLPVTPSPALITQAAQFLGHNEQIVEPRAHWPDGALEEQVRHGTIAVALRPQPGRALSVWGDDGWGSLVRRGKWETGRFDNALVDAAAGLVRERWIPDPWPAWVTCVPSQTHPDLIPDFARRLAAALALPFVPCLRKTRTTEPQKRMQNSFRQARNLDGAFAVETWSGIDGPVLLVDDMVDSRWTFTVVAALLREAGSGPVYPLALALSLGA